MKKLFSAAAILLVFSMVLTACGSAATTTAAPAEPTTEAATEPAATAPAATEPAATAAPAATEDTSAGAPVKLVYWTFSDYTAGAPGDMMKEFISEFEAQNPNITVELVGKPDTDIESGLIAGASSGELPDLFNLAYNAGEDVASLGIVKDVSSMWNAMPDDYRQQFSEKAVQGLQVDNKMYGLPFTAYSAILYRNLTVLKAAGIDPSAGIKDWADWLSQMQKVQDAGYKAMGNYTGDGWFIMIFLGGIQGVQNAVVDGKTTITADQLAKAYDFLKSASQYCTDASPADQATSDLFTTNKLAFMPNGPWADPTYKAVEGLDYDAVVIPGETADYAGGVHGGEFFGLTDGPNAEAAWKLATFLAGKEQMIRFGSQLGRANFNDAAMNDATVQANTLVALTSKAASMGMPDAAYFQPFPLKVRQPLTDYAIQAVKGDMTPEDAAQKAIDTINDILASQ